MNAYTSKFPTYWKIFWAWFEGRKDIRYVRPDLEFGNMIFHSSSNP